MYDPQTGTFLEEDPLGLGGGDTNEHRYVGNRPTTMIDPSGLEAEELDDEHPDPVTNAPKGAPPDVQVVIGDLFSNPELLKQLQQLAKQQARSVEIGGYVCWNKAKDRLVLYVFDDTTRNTTGSSPRTWFAKNGRPLLGNPPDKQNPRQPDPNLIIYYGFHTHPIGRDAWPSKKDCDNSQEWRLPEIVLHYYEPLGTPTWLFHIVGPNGKYYEWTPPTREDR